MVWLFGYGSLIWKAGFPYERRVPGYIEGWTRRFWQESADHRGVPEAPGRVVTLVPRPRGRVWGMAYQLDPQRAPAILEGLDVREKGGYERHLQPLFSADHELLCEEALLYVGAESNHRYAGPAAVDEIVAVILRSEGPSGHNVEYLLRLHQCLELMGAVDEHVDDLAEEARRRAPSELRTRFSELFF